MADLHPRPNMLLFMKRLCNFNTTGDNILVKQFACATFAINQIRIGNPSVSLNVAVGGIYTAPLKGGISVVAVGTAYSSLVPVTGPAANFALLPVGLAEIAADALYLSLTTPQGTDPSTADVFVFGWPLS